MPGWDRKFMIMKRRSAPRSKRWRWLMGFVLAGALLLGGLAALNEWPVLGAEGADLLRPILGDRGVAALEAGVFTIQDTLHQWAYHLGLASPIAPAGGPTSLAVNSSGPPLLMPTFTPFQPGTSSPFSPESNTPNLPGTSTPFQPEATPLFQQTQAAGAPRSLWQPAPLLPLSGLRGEGTWSPYIQDSSGRTVAYLTSFQPDPVRAYAVAAAVAFDLGHARLHFVLGTIEPYAPGSPPRSGAIPLSDRAPGVLLAMFNGGFKARHGEFGAMENGMVALPARAGLGTVAIGSQGGVHIGAWGVDILPSLDWVSWRQNGPLVIQQGAINPRVYNNSPSDWGYTVSGAAPTWRSAIGLSADGQTLYYVCGPSLTIETLAASLVASGSAWAIQLDINPYWVHFVAVRTDGKKLILEPLFPAQMRENIDRYLWNYTRDYFYVTAAP
jgi:hypothetical protein